MFVFPRPLSCSASSTPQTPVSPSSSHYPSRDHRGTLSTESPESPGKPLDMRPRCRVSCPQSSNITSAGLFPQTYLVVDLVAYVLVDKHNGNIFPPAREALKSRFDRRVFGFAIDDEVVFLRVRGIGDVLRFSISILLVSAIWNTYTANIRLRLRAGCR